MDLMPRVLGVASMKDLLLSLTAPLEANIGHIMAESYPGTQIYCYLRYPVPIHANSCTMVPSVRYTQARYSSQYPDIAYR